MPIIYYRINTHWKKTFENNREKLHTYDNKYDQNDQEAPVVGGYKKLLKYKKNKQIQNVIDSSL